MNLEGAKAMAHLQGGPGTKATVGFEQDEALYLVYDNNEIRLPEITFTVEFPCDMFNIFTPLNRDL